MSGSAAITTNRPPLVVWLTDPACADSRLVGHKAAHLGALSQRYPVPAGFCVTTASHALSGGADDVPDAVKTEISEAYRQLGEDDPPVAVRSSAVDEDSPEASFAGQHETFLNVRGVDELLTALAGTWRSARSEGALRYRRDRGLPADDIALGVLVQRLVAADSSGVAFSVDPVSGNSDQIVISANWGLGESLVGGTINPDRWRFDKVGPTLLEQSVGDKERLTIPADTGVHEVRAPTFLRQRPSLSPEEATAVAALTLELEELQGWPVDVEFALTAGRLQLLQCRPVTTLAERA